MDACGVVFDYFDDDIEFYGYVISMISDIVKGIGNELMRYWI